MKNKFLLIAVMVISIAVVAGVIASQSMKPDTTSNKNDPMMSRDTTVKQAANTVIIQDYAFSPSPITVKKGTAVTWTNKDMAKHNIEMDEGQPEGGPAESPLLNKGETYSYTFDTVGTFNYHCSPHPYMKGSVVVVES